ncbi:MAG TPA: exodeoxyribonuclease VII large subunit, partial [Thermoanaerobaculia bacterium]|nr:exodeoxyribonuclease VII large subunit [Thermoanaerobaculia bacterium]
ARRLERAAQAPRLLAHRLADRAAARLALVAARLEGHQRLLAEIGPERVLARGFSITRFADGRLLRDAAEAAAGSRLVTRLARGSVTSSVEER